MASGADAVILDLEDLIAPERKEQARECGARIPQGAHAQAQRPRLLVRINGLDTGMTDADLDAVVAGKPDAILFPKAEGGASVTHLDAKLTAREAIAGCPRARSRFWRSAVEIGGGAFPRWHISRSSPRLIGLTWGPEDLSAELGAEANREADGTLTEPYRLARSICLFGGGGGEGTGDRDHPRQLPQPDVLRRDTELARRDGFTGRLAIHPAQVAVINEVFTPSPEQIAKAKAVVAAFAAKPGAGAVGIDGKMYDRPHLMRAQALLARVG